MEYWHFKQFSVLQEGVTWKVGTDGVLLGAWTQLGSAKRILDIGTGTGIVSLMVAQRHPYCTITAVEIDKRTAEVAKVNFNESPWSDRLSVIRADAHKLYPECPFDHIICNPPYFDRGLRSEDLQRFRARSAEGFDAGNLPRLFADLLSVAGSVSMIYPISSSDCLIDQMRQMRLFPHRKCVVRHKTDSKITRVLLELGRDMGFCKEEELVLYRDFEPSSDYRKLLRPYRRKEK